jgi:cytoskeleton protein RodZ
MTEKSEQQPEADAAPSAPRATDLLAARRAELGLSLEDVANQLKFAPRQIEALEAGAFDRLPGGTFARGMIRSYARLLKLEPEPALAQLSQSTTAVQPGPEEAVSLRTPIPFSEGGRFANVAYAAMSVVILTSVIFFALEWYQEKSGPQKLVFVAPGQDAPASSDSSAASAANPSAANESATAARSESVPPPAQLASAAPARMTETTASPEEAKSDPRLVPVAAGKKRLVLHFDKEAWVEVKGRNGTLLSQLNPAGSEKVVDGDPPFQLTIGNAPNVRLTYNDQPVDLRPHFKVDVARLTLN